MSLLRHIGTNCACTHSYIPACIHDASGHRNAAEEIAADSGVRRNFHGGVFIQWHMVVICVWCALFVTSQFDVIFMFSSEVC